MTETNEADGEGGAEAEAVDLELETGTMSETAEDTVIADPEEEVVVVVGAEMEPDRTVKIETMTETASMDNRMISTPNTTTTGPRATTITDSKVAVHPHPRTNPADGLLTANPIINDPSTDPRRPALSFPMRISLRNAPTPRW